VSQGTEQKYDAVFFKEMVRHKVKGGEEKISSTVKKDP
jgi:hypothetical protein